MALLLLSVFTGLDWIDDKRNLRLHVNQVLQLSDVSQIPFLVQKEKFWQDVELCT